MPHSDRACFLVRPCPKCLNCVRLRMRTKISGTASGARFPLSTASVTVSKSRYTFCSASSTRSSGQASSKHKTMVVSPGIAPPRIFGAKSLIPGIYIVAPRQYCSSSLSVYLLNSSGSTKNLKSLLYRWCLIFFILSFYVFYHRFTFLY